MFFFFFNDTATTEIYTLSLHDALPICVRQEAPEVGDAQVRELDGAVLALLERAEDPACGRSEEHTSELQSRLHLVCRLLLEKKKNHASPRPPENALSVRPAPPHVLPSS